MRFAFYYCDPAAVNLRWTVISNVCFSARENIQSIRLIFEPHTLIWTAVVLHRLYMDGSECVHGHVCLSSASFESGALGTTSLRLSTSNLLEHMLGRQRSGGYAFLEVSPALVLNPKLPKWPFLLPSA